MSNQSQSPSQQVQSSQSASDVVSSTETSSQAHGEAQQPVVSPLPISPYTGEPYDPEWGAIIQKGRGGQQTIQQIMKVDLERKTSQ